MKQLFCLYHLSIVGKPSVWLILISFCINGKVLAQKQPDLLTREIVISKKDSVVRANILIKNEDIKTEENLTFYWYFDDNIKSTQGDYTGYLLHDSYIVFYANNSLKTKGFFNYGLKDGNWRYWHNNGKLYISETWKRGKKEGKTSIYNIQGKLIKTEEYRDGGLNGDVTIYENGVIIEKIRYSNGVKQLPGASDEASDKKQKEHLKIRFPFSKKNKADSQNENQP